MREWLSEEWEQGRLCVGGAFLISGRRSRTKPWNLDRERYACCPCAEGASAEEAASTAGGGQESAAPEGANPIEAAAGVDTPSREVCQAGQQQRLVLPGPRFRRPTFQLLRDVECRTLARTRCDDLSCTPDSKPPSRYQRREQQPQLVRSTVGSSWPNSRSGPPSLPSHQLIGAQMNPR
jgi:hypothetical protein